MQPRRWRSRRAAVLSAAGLLGALWAGGAFAAGAAARAGGGAPLGARASPQGAAPPRPADPASGDPASGAGPRQAAAVTSAGCAAAALLAVAFAARPPRRAARLGGQGKRAVACRAAVRIALDEHRLPPPAAEVVTPTPAPAAGAAAPAPEPAARLAPAAVEAAVLVPAVPAPGVTPARTTRAGGAARFVGGRRFSRAWAGAARATRGARRAAGARLAPRQEAEPVAVSYDPSRVRVKVQLGLRVLQGPQIPSARQARALSASGLSNTAGELVSTDFYIDFGT